jgi:VWFA-related protein
MKNRVRRLVLLALAASSAAGLSGARLPQDIQHETRAVNIEVPVRVYRDGAFVDDLTLGDFELVEDGKPQKIEAFYLVKKRVIERREEAKEFAPRTARHFFLFFELGDYDAKLTQALDYFVKTVLLPGDNLTIVTPMKTYRMKGELFHLVGRDKTYAQVVGLLRRDIQIGYSESRAILAEMTDLARVMASNVRARDAVAEAALLTPVEPVGGLPVESPYQGVALEEQLMHYGSLLERLGNLRVVDEKKLLAFADHLKNLEGQKGVFFFYQREFIPKIDARVVDLLATKYSERPDITQALDTIFGLQRRETSLNVDVVTKAYADASAAVHFLFITRPAERAEGMRMEERSEDIFGPFREMARATGGFSESSANIAAAMRSAVEASENYYLLYYTPAEYRADGRFRRLAVRVRNGAYRVSHRLGYIAD